MLSTKIKITQRVRGEMETGGMGRGVCAILTLMGGGGLSPDVTCMLMAN